MLREAALHTIGQPSVPNFADPLGLMSHCHRKIEGYLAGLTAAGEILLGGRPVELAGAFQVIDAAREHFALRLPKHTEDEEVSLFPRLREYGGHEAEESLAALAALETEHRVAEGVHAEFDELVEWLPRDGSAAVKEIYLFNELVAELADLYRPHIRVEDEIIFPAAARVIPSDALSIIGQEMRARRRELLTGLRGGITNGLHVMARR
ncbi:MAG: hemerythrin domain-containing protein [Pyrinomonadaceae bacterium]|nr:hemerythrin domain-containing protein [Pyrinomonadaceae bacterium]